MVVLVIFMVLTAIALERAVVKRALQAEEDGLQLLVYSLLAAVDRDVDGHSLVITEDRLFETDLATRNSGLYALLYDRKQREIWRSRSTTIDFLAISRTALGDWDFDIVEQRSAPYFRLGFALQWLSVTLTNQTKKWLRGLCDSLVQPKSINPKVNAVSRLVN